MQFAVNWPLASHPCAGRRSSGSSGYVVKNFVHLTAAAGLLSILPWWPALAQDCRTSDLASFSKLGRAVAEARAHQPGQLLAAWLLRPRAGGGCQFVFRVDLLMQNGQVHSMNFDARTLEPVEIANERDWVEAGGEGGGGSGSGNASGTGQGSGDGVAGNDDGDNSGQGSGGSASSAGNGDDGGDDSSGDSSGSGSGDHGGSGGSDSGGGGSGGSGSGGGDD